MHMRTLSLSLLMLLLLFLPSAARREESVQMTATWIPSGAVVSWQQPPGVRETCLYRYYGATWPAAICWRDLPAGTQMIELPGTLTHPAYTPADGDRYDLHFEGAVAAQATLGEVKMWRVYLGGVQKQTPAVWRVWLPWVGSTS